MSFNLEFRIKYVPIQRKIQNLLGSNFNQEQFERQRAEYLICSRPCCGRTWLRVLIGHTLKKESKFELSHFNPQSLFYLHQLNPTLPSIKATHELFSDVEDYANKNVILLVRDPRAALFSRTRKKIKRCEDLTQKDFRNIFRDVKYLTRTIQFYNEWAKHQTCAKSFMILRYEDLVENTYQELHRVLSFMQLSPSREVIESAIANSTFDKMQKFDKRSFKFGSGKPRDFSNSLDQEDLGWAEQYILNSLNPVYKYNYQS